MTRFVLEVGASEAGQRLDRMLSERLRTPRNQIQRWIREGQVQVDGRPAKASHPVEAGETVVCTPQVVDAAEGLEPETGAIELLFEDQDLVAIDKPAGLVVHPGAGHVSGTLVHRLLDRYPEISGVGGRGRPGIVHRLDKDTTGVLLIARTTRAYEAVSRAFAERRVEKTYLAIAYGRPSAATGTIDAPIGRHPTRRQQMAVHERGRPAVTRYRTLAVAGGLALLEIDLATGRTHQIRVHLKSAGLPLVGDPVYGEARWKAWPRRRWAALESFPRPALHAWRLRLAHPTTGGELRLEAPVPADLRTLWKTVTDTPFPALD